MKLKIYIVLFLMTTLMTSCKTVYVPVESVRTEYRDRLRTDSIHVLDSIHIREKGDTVWLTRWRTEYRDKLRVDSVFIRDSIQVPYPVEPKLTRWQSLKMDMGGIAIGGLLVMVIGFVVWWIIRARKK